VKLRLPGEDACNSRAEGMHHVSGEKPTRAGPEPRAEAADCSAAGDWPWGGTRVALRGVVTKWSVSGELVRFRVVALQIGAPVPFPRVAWEAGERPRLSPPGCSWIDPEDAQRAYRSRQARWQPAMTTGTLTSSPANVAGVTGRYKRCEIRPGRDVETGGLSRLFGGLSIFPVKAPLERRRPGVAAAQQAGDRGE
jgi:hypothetical protein